MIRVFAPAKVNLALHVTGLRADGFHLLDMLVGFADVGDWVTLAPAQTAGLSVIGPESAALGAPNIISRVADDFGAAPLKITLEKNLPVASGIGGGSADAAAAYRGIMALQHRAPQQNDMTRLLAIGADVPMCVTSVPALVRGIGEDILPLPQIAPLPILLVNPRVQLSTAAVFKALVQKQNAPIAPLPDDISNSENLIAWLQNQRNDLQNPAIQMAPIIADTITQITQTGAVLARMSGSGATCFGIYPSADHAQHAAAELRKNHPNWWITPAQMNGAINIAPQLMRATV